MSLRKSSKKNTPEEEDDAFIAEVDELVNWLDENQAKPPEIKGNDISSTLTKFSKSEIMRLGESMLALENNKKVLKSWVKHIDRPQRLTDYLGEISKLQELSNFSENELIAITLMSDCYIEYQEKWNDPDKELTAEELLTRLIQKSVELDAFPPELFEEGIDFIHGYATIFPTGYKNHSDHSVEDFWSRHYSLLKETKNETLNRIRWEQREQHGNQICFILWEVLMDTFKFPSAVFNSHFSRFENGILNIDFSDIHEYSEARPNLKIALISAFQEELGATVTSRIEVSVAVSRLTVEIREH
jgi:hypothetical protein